MKAVLILLASPFALLLLGYRTPPPPPAVPLGLEAIVPGSVVSQGFGCTPLALEPVDPSCPSGHSHSGIDLAAPAGTEVFAAAPGVADVINSAGGYGLHVVIHEDSTTVTLYGHLESAAVESGEQVEVGQRVGRVGSTGLSTGPHLHFEVRREGRPVDPKL